MSRSSARAARDHPTDERLVAQRRPQPAAATPATATPRRPAEVLALQRAAGNRAVQHLLAGPQPTATAPVIQRAFVTQTANGLGQPASYSVNFSDYQPRQVAGLPPSPPQRRKKAIANQFHWIGGVLANAAQYQASLIRLDEAVQQRRLALPPAARTPTRALDLVLADQETAVGLRAAPKPTLTGFVHAQDFARLLRSGTVFKDLGAGAEHGEFTHRIQWYIIADQWAAQNRAALPEVGENGLTLLDIYKASGDPSFFRDTALAADPATAQKTPWDFIVDAQLDMYETEQAGLASQPERLNSDLTWGGVDGGGTRDALELSRFMRLDADANAPGLIEALVERRQKRSAEEAANPGVAGSNAYRARKQAQYPNLVATGQQVVLPGIVPQQDNPLFYKTQDEYDRSTFNNP